MPVLRVSSRLSGGVLFQPLPSARQQILFHNPPSPKSSEIVIHDTTILERMQEVSSRIPENGKCGILKAGADKNTWPFLFSKKWYHIPTSAAGTLSRRPIRTFIWNMKAMLRTAPIWKMCFKCLSAPLRKESRSGCPAAVSPQRRFCKLRKVCSCNSDFGNRIHRGLRHSLSIPIRSAGSGMDGAVCLRETAFLFHHSICAGKSRCRRFLDLVSGKIFPIRREKQLRLSQLYVILVVHIPSRNGADHAFPAEYGKRTELKGTEQL